MKKQANAFKAIFFIVSVIFVNYGLSQDEIYRNGDYVLMRNDSVQNYRNDYWSQLNLDDRLEKGYQDIIICTEGVGSSLIHFEIKGSSVTVFKYEIANDSLSLKFKRQADNKDLAKLNLITGYFQVGSEYEYFSETTTYNNRYFKEISYYKDLALLSRVLFLGVKESNRDLPAFEQINPFIESIWQLEAMFPEEKKSKRLK